ncbi:MAG: 30S ribosomal protein S20 [Parvularculales bacterium]
MANTKSAKNMNRKIARRTAVNRVRLGQMRRSIRHVEEAVVSGDKAQALDALKTAESRIMRTAQQGVIHCNAASRKVSRLSRRVQAMR